MATGLSIVTDAMYGSGVLGADEALADADAQLCLRRLNRLMDSWSNLRGLCYEISTDSFTMTAGTASYSSALLLVDGRPLNLDSMYVRLSNIDYPVEIITAQEWSEITYKPVTSVPAKCYIDSAYPDLTFNFYPAPNAAYTCFVNDTKALPATIALATTISLPPGYERALVDSLAVDLCPSFGMTPSPAAMQSRREALEALRRTNLSVPVLDSPAFSNNSDLARAGLIYGWW